MTTEDRGQKKKDSGVVATAPRFLNNRAAQRRNKLLSSVLSPLSSDACPLSSESGTTLIISLIILIILMLLGMAAMNSSGIQFLLAANLRFENMAMNNAETAAEAAERWLENNAATQASASAVADIPLTYSVTSYPLSGMSWDDADLIASRAVAAADGTPDDSKRYVTFFTGVYASPLAGIGLDCTDPSNEKNYDCVNTYLVTARGLGPRGASRFIQVYYAVPLK